MKILVTGAGGAVGSYVVEQLADKGHFVTATDLSEVSILPQLGVQIYSADLTNMSYSDIKHLVKGHDAVINTAAIVDIGKGRRDVWPLNVYVTKKLAQAASEEFFCKFIHISSGSIYAPSEKLIKEDYRVVSNSPYEASKISSERAIKEIWEKSSEDFTYTILRPALIYGPEAKFLGATLAAIPPILRTYGLTHVGVSGGPITNWVHAEDVARACIHAIDNEETDNKTFNIADDTPTPFGDTASDYMEAYGLKLKGRIPLPSIEVLRLLEPIINRNLTFSLINKPLAYAWKQVERLNFLNSKLSVKVDKEASPYIFHNTVFDTTSLKNTGFYLNWPNHKEAIPGVLNWYEDNNWIPER